MNENAKDRFVAAEKERWAALVDEAKFFGDGIIEQARKLTDGTNLSPASVKGKIQAIRWAMMNNWSVGEVKEKGQSVTLRAYAKAKKNGHNERERILRWRVPASLADAIQSDNASPDAEEALVSRLARVLGISTSEEFWSYLHAHFGGMSDEQIRHDGGEGPPEKKRK